MIRSLKRRVTGVIVVFMLALGIMVGATAAASAEMKCKTVANVSIGCLTINAKGGGLYEVIIGVDAVLDPAEVQQILSNDPALAFTALLMADDPGPNDTPLISIPFVSAGGDGDVLGANFGRDVGGSLLNEDSDGTDELYGRIILFNKFTNVTRVYDTGVISRSF